MAALEELKKKVGKKVEESILGKEKAEMIEEIFKLFNDIRQSFTEMNEHLESIEGKLDELIRVSKGGEKVDNKER